MKTMINNLAELLKVKSLLTLTFTVAVIIFEVVLGGTPEWFQAIYQTVVIFYFGVQHQKNQQKIDEKTKENSAE